MASKIDDPVVALEDLQHRVKHPIDLIEASIPGEEPWHLQQLLKYPDQRVRCLAFAGMNLIREGKRAEGERLLDCAVGLLDG